MSTPPTSPVPGRRERNKRATWERVYAAAIDLFAQHGYDAVSIENITDRADVGRATFFNHFDRKEDVVDAWIDRRRARLQARLAAIVTAEQRTAVRLEGCMHVLATINAEDWSEGRVMVAAWVRAGRPIVATPTLATVLAGIVADGLARGEIAAGTDPAATGLLLHDYYLGTVYRFIDRSADPSGLEAELLAGLHLLMNGIRPPGRG